MPSEPFTSRLTSYSRVNYSHALPMSGKLMGRFERRETWWSRRCLHPVLTDLRGMHLSDDIPIPSNIHRRNLNCIRTEAMAEPAANPTLLKRVESANFIGYTEAAGTCEFTGMLFFHWIKLKLANKTTLFFAPTGNKSSQPRAHIGVVHHPGRQMQFQLLA